VTEKVHAMADGADLPTRELYHQWLRALTVLTEPGGRPLPERLELIRQVNPPGKVTVRIATPISVEDADALDEAISRVDRLRSRETGVHALVTALLLQWLSDATGSTRSEIITRLALTIDRMLPPDDEPAPTDRNR
jgi:hypothetical protein